MRSKPAVVLISSVSLLTGCLDGLTDPDSSSPARLAGDRRNIVVAGAGLASQPAVLEVTVPVPSTEIVSAKFRWVGRGSHPDGDSRILINGHQRSGTLLASYEVGGDAPWVTFHEWDAQALIRPGTNRFYVSAFDLVEPARADGIGLAIVYRDPESPWTSVVTVDPLEFVSSDRGAVWELPIGASREVRNGRLILFAGDCNATSTDHVWWSTGLGPVARDLVGVAPNVISNRLGASEGSWMDILSEDVSIPAFTSNLAYQLESPSDGTGDAIVHFFGAVCTDGETTSCTGSVAGRVWRDLDQDGLQDGGEPGLGAVPVHLRDGAGLAVASASTDADGAFSFDLLCAGDYVVEVDETALPAGLASTTCAAGDCSPQSVVLATDDAVVDLAFGWNEPPSTGACYQGMGFWKHEFDVYTQGHPGHRHLDDGTLDALLVRVSATSALDWTGGDGSLDAQDAIRALESTETVCDRSRRHYFACLLNYAFNGAYPSTLVDSDADGAPDMSYGELIEHVDALFLSGETEGCRAGKRMAESVNGMSDSGDCPF